MAQKYQKLSVLASAALFAACSARGPQGLTTLAPQTEASNKFERATALARVAVGFADAGQPEESSQILAQSLHLANSLPDAKLLVLPEVALGYAEVGQYSKALEVIKPIKTNVWGTLALYQIITEAIAAKHYDQALQLSKELGNEIVGREDGYQYTKAKTLARIANEATRTEPKDKAEQILEQALQQTKTLQSVPQQAFAIADIAISYAAVGQQAKASQLLEQALQVIDSEDGTPINADALAEIAVNYAEVGQQAKALQLLEQAYQDTNGVALPLAEVAVNYAEVGQRAQALQFLDQALETVRKSQSRAVKFYELNEIAIKYAKVGQYDRAFQIVELINQWYPPNDADELELGGITRDALTEIAIQYAEAGRCDRALQLARRVRYQSNRATALTEIAVEYAKRRQYDQALQIVQSLDSDIFKGIAVDPRKARTLSEIVARMAQAESAERAVQFLDQALEVVKSIKHEADKVDALTAIASQYAIVGQPAKASKLLDQALHLART